MQTMTTRQRRASRSWKAVEIYLAMGRVRMSFSRCVDMWKQEQREFNICNYWHHSSQGHSQSSYGRDRSHLRPDKAVVQRHTT